MANGSEPGAATDTLFERFREGSARFFEILRRVRLTIEKMKLAPETKVANWAAFGALVLVFFFARVTTAGNDPSPSVAIILALISSGLLSLVGLVSIFVDKNGDAGTSQKWTAFFLFLWFFSLILVIVVDGIATWKSQTTPTFQLINLVFGKESGLDDGAVNWIRAVFFSVLAGLLALLRTKQIDPTQRLTDLSVLIELAVGIAVNSVLLRLFVYTNLI
ncbi:MAG: hypothetical protein JO000_22335 [Alphaproteobacteria bacterium]|nr:hypothetical protein [Alphaproteobacteria bacterium]